MVKINEVVKRRGAFGKEYTVCAVKDEGNFVAFRQWNGDVAKFMIVGDVIGTLDNVRPSNTGSAYTALCDVATFPELEKLFKGFGFKYSLKKLRAKVKA